MSNEQTQLTWFDKAIGKVYAPYLTKAIQHRTAQQGFQNVMRRDDRGRKDSSGYANQPFGYGSQRTLTPNVRRRLVRESRDMSENNALAHALIARSVDNIVGEGMQLKPMSSDAGFNREVKQWWHEVYQADASGRFSNSELQRLAFGCHYRDGDVGAAMLRSGQLQFTESDYIRSPNRSGDQYGRSSYNPEIVDGVHVNSSGRPIAYHVETVNGRGGVDYPAIPARNFLFLANYDRANYTAQRGVPVLSIIRPLLQHIDATNEAVVTAHRIAASFGVFIEKENPGASATALPNLSGTPSSGDINKAFQIKPGMVEFGSPGQKMTQIKPEHPTSSYSEFMSFQIRMAGVVLGLPLELALLDFSKTNYSSAKASLEQAYRSFRVKQNRFKTQWLNKWYRWRVSKAVNMGEFGSAIPDDYQRHDWLAQPWPFLDPVKDAQGVLASTDAGMTLLTDELAKRGYEFSEWIEMRSAEIKQAADAGVPLFHSNMSRDPQQQTNETQPEIPDDADPSED